MTAVTCSSYQFFGQICHIPRNRDAKQLDDHVSEKKLFLLGQIVLLRIAYCRSDTTSHCIVDGCASPLLVHTAHKVTIRTRIRV